jgi:predicted  nucleic acid-binding Zn-ribbon protein
MELDSEVEELPMQIKPVEAAPKDAENRLGDGVDDEKDMYTDSASPMQPFPASAPMTTTLPRVEHSAFQSWLGTDGELLPPPPPLPSVEEAIRALGREPEFPELAPFVCGFGEPCAPEPELSTSGNRPGGLDEEPLFSPEPQAEAARSPSPNAPLAETVDASKLTANTDSPLANDLAKLRDAATYAKNNIVILQSHRRRVKSRFAKQAKDMNDKLLAINGRFTDFEQGFKSALEASESAADHRYGTLHQMAEDNSREMEDILDRVADLECSLAEIDERDEARSKDLNAYEEQLQQLITTTTELCDAAKQRFDAELAAMREARAEAAAVTITAQALPEALIEVRPHSDTYLPRTG